MNPDDRPEPPGLDLEALAREMPFPPTWEDTKPPPPRPSPLDVRVGPDPMPRRPPRRPRP